MQHFCYIQYTYSILSEYRQEKQEQKVACAFDVCLTVCLIYFLYIWFQQPLTLHLARVLLTAIDYTPSSSYVNWGQALD